MVELIITGRNGIDRESIADYKLDAAWGADENDFELTVDRLIDAGSYVYFVETEWTGVPRRAATCISTGPNAAESWTP